MAPSIASFQRNQRKKKIKPKWFLKNEQQSSSSDSSCNCDSVLTVLFDLTSKIKRKTMNLVKSYQNSHKSWKEIFISKLKSILIWILTLKLLLFLPIVTLSTFCMIIFRYILGILAKYKRPDLGCMLESRNVGFGADLIYNNESTKNSSQFPLILSLVLDGHVELNEFRHKINNILETKNIIVSPPSSTSSSPSSPKKKSNNKRKNSSSSSSASAYDVLSVLRYPEFKQYIVSWFGILFWKWEHDFKLENHVKLLDVAKYTINDEKTLLNENDLNNISSKLLAEPFTQDQSPWEFLLIHNYCHRRDKRLENSPTCTLVLFRVHSVLGNELSLFQFCKENDDRHGDENGTSFEAFESVGAKNIKYSSCMKSVPLEDQISYWVKEKLYVAFVYPIIASFELASLIVKSGSFNFCRRRRTKSQLRFETSSNSIPMEYLERIKNKYGVSTTTILLALYAGALRKVALERNLKVCKSTYCLTTFSSGEFPEDVHEMTTSSLIKLPLTLQSPMARVLAIERNLQKMNNSTIPTTMYYLMEFGGLSFARLASKIFGKLSTTSSIMMNNFTGSCNSIVNFAGHEVFDCKWFGQYGNNGVGMSISNFNGFVQITVTYDENIRQQPNHESCKGQFIKTIMEELRRLNEFNIDHQHFQLEELKPLLSSCSISESHNLPLCQEENHFNSSEDDN